MNLPARIPEASFPRIIDRTFVIGAVGISIAILCCSYFAVDRPLPATSRLAAFLALFCTALVGIALPDVVRRRRIAVMRAVLSANEHLFARGSLKPHEAHLIACRWINAGFTPPRALDALRRGAIDPIGTFAEERWFWREVSRKYQSLPLHTGR
jgi:hypothetical protein